MTHRRNVAMIDAGLPADAIVDAVLESTFTRLPLYRGESDNITGVLHAKALLREMRARRGEVGGIDISALAAQPWFIPDSTSLLDPLLAFRERRNTLPVVADQIGPPLCTVPQEDPK